MPYSDKEMREIGRDPVRLRAWWWHMAMHHQRLSKKKYARSRSTGVLHPVTNYRPQFEEGFDLVHWARTSERVSQTILDSLDAFVRSSLEPASCTCRALGQ